MGKISIKSIVNMVSATYESSSDSVILVSTNDKILWQNRSAHQNFADIMDNKKLSTLFTPTAYSLIKEKMATSSVFDFSENNIKYHFVPVLKDDKYTYFVAVLTADTTTRLLDIAQSGDVSSIFSSHYKNPLFRIFSTLTLLNRNLEKADNETGLAYSQQITKDAYLMLRNTQNLEMFLQMDTKEFDSKMVYADFSKFMEELCESLSHLLKDARLPFSYSIISEPILTSFNQKTLSLAIANIILNAYKNLIKDKDNVVSLNMDINGDNIIIKISDNGIGIPQDKISSIYEPFYTHADNDDEPYGGMGLGLTVTKHIIEVHGGNIVVTSNVDEGTTFIISLPIRKISITEDELLVKNTDTNFTRNRFSSLYVQLAEIINTPMQ